MVTSGSGGFLGLYLARQVAVLLVLRGISGNSPEAVAKEMIMNPIIVIKDFSMFENTIDRTVASRYGQSPVSTTNSHIRGLYSRETFLTWWARHSTCIIQGDEAQKEFNEHCQAYLKTTVWIVSCNSWYKQGIADGKSNILQQHLPVSGADEGASLGRLTFHI